MTIYPRPLLVFCVASVLTAQSPLAVLKLIPASAGSVELTWKLSDSNERYLKATTPLGVKEGIVPLERTAHLALADVAPGTIAVVNFDEPEETRASKSPKKKSPMAKEKPDTKKLDWSVMLLPVKSPKELAKRLQAKAAGALQRYEWQTGNGVEQRYLGFREGYALVAERRESLEQVLKPGPSIETELAPLSSWILQHDSVMVVTEKSVRKAAEAMIRDDASTKSPIPGAAGDLFSGMLKELGEKVRTSVRHTALALDLPQDGSLRLTARAFFKMGSPLAVEAAALPALTGHPLGRLPEGPYAFAMGGQWPRSLRLFKKLTQQLPGLKEEDRETAAKLQAAANEQIQQISFSLQAPAQPGDPLFQGLWAVVELKDGKAWMEAMKRQQAWAQDHMNGTCSYQVGVLPDLPSLTVSLDLGRVMGNQVPPVQMVMVTSLLFGANRMQISYAIVDGHTLAYTFGDRDALKRLVEKIRENKPLAASKGIQSADPLLPKDGRFVIYLDPRGVQTLVVTVIKSFMGPEKNISLPQLAETIPLSGAVSMDSGGIQFCGSARPESLEAMAKVFTGISQAFSDEGKKDKAEPGKEAEDPDETDETEDPDESEDEDA